MPAELTWQLYCLVHGMAAPDLAIHCMPACKGDVLFEAFSCRAHRRQDGLLSTCIWTQPQLNSDVLASGQRTNLQGLPLSSQGCS